MAESDRAAVDVEFVHVDAELFRYREDLSGEGFVDFDQVDVVERHARFFQRDLRRRNGTAAHDVGIAAGDTPRDHAAQRLPVLRVVRVGDYDHRSAVDDAAGIAGGDEAVFRERG